MQSKYRYERRETFWFNWHRRCVRSFIPPFKLFHWFAEGNNNKMLRDDAMPFGLNSTKPQSFKVLNSLTCIPFIQPIKSVNENSCWIGRKRFLMAAGCNTCAVNCSCAHQTWRSSESVISHQLYSSFTIRHITNCQIQIETQNPTQSNVLRWKK